MDKVWVTLDEISIIGITKPEQKVWCISKDGNEDFIAKAEDIRKSIKDTKSVLEENIGKVNWADFNFGILSDEIVKEIADNTQGNTSFVINKPNSNYKVRTFISKDLLFLENRINEFIADMCIENIINIMYQAFNGCGGDTYTAMILYI